MPCCLLSSPPLLYWRENYRASGVRYKYLRLHYCVHICIALCKEGPRIIIGKPASLCTYFLLSPRHHDFLHHVDTYTHRPATNTQRILFAKEGKFLAGRWIFVESVVSAEQLFPCCVARARFGTDFWCCCMHATKLFVSIYLSNSEPISSENLPW